MVSFSNVNGEHIKTLIWTFKDNVPSWWDRLCNGGVCYCNDTDGCNLSSKVILNILALLPAIIFMVVRQSSYHLYLWYFSIINTNKWFSCFNITARLQSPPSRRKTSNKMKWRAGPGLDWSTQLFSPLWCLTRIISLDYTFYQLLYTSVRHELVRLNMFMLDLNILNIILKSE